MDGKALAEALGVADHWSRSNAAGIVGTHAWAMATLAAEVRRLAGAVPVGGVALIAAERERQVAVEGWTPEHDDGHNLGEIADAAACYTTQAYRRQMHMDGAPTGWPWSALWWRPSPNDRVRELVKAGALIAAEIDRLQRAAAAEAAREGRGT